MLFIAACYLEKDHASAIGVLYCIKNNSMIIILILILIIIIIIIIIIAIIIGERAKRARHSQVCTIENRR